MVAPFPPDARVGAIAPAQRMEKLIADLKWLARWSDEIGADPDLDMKKLAQLAFQHCRMVREALDPLAPLDATSPLMRALHARCLSHAILWPTVAAMTADLTAIHAKAGELFALVRDTMPEARQLSMRVYDAAGGETEQPFKRAKADFSAAVAKVAELRALFA